jgi:hypothetical protein
MQLKLRRALKLEIRTPSQANAFVAATVRIEALAAKYQYETQSLENRERQAQRIHDEYMLQLQTEHLKAATAAVAAGVDPTAIASNSAAVLQGAGLRQGAGFNSFVEHQIHGGFSDVPEAGGGFHPV